MKKFFCIMIGLFCMLYLSGCFNKEEKTEEFMEYMNGFMKTEENYPLSSMLTIRMHEVTDSGIDNKELKEKVTNHILPALEKRIEYHESAELEDKKLRTINESMLDYMKRGDELFEDVKEKLQEGTNKEINDAKEEMMSYIIDSDHTYEEIMEKLIDLKDKYDLHIITEENNVGEKQRHLSKKEE